MRWSLLASRVDWPSKLRDKKKYARTPAGRPHGLDSFLPDKNDHPRQATAARWFVSVGFSSLTQDPEGVQPASARQFVTLSSAQVLKSVPGIAHFMKSNTPGGWVLGPFYLFPLFKCVPYAAFFLQSHSEHGGRSSEEPYGLFAYSTRSPFCAQTTSSLSTQG